MEFSPKTERGLGPEVAGIIEKLQKMEPKNPVVKDNSVHLKPPTSSPSPKKPKGNWQSFAERSLPNGDRD